MNVVWPSQVPPDFYIREEHLDDEDPDVRMSRTCASQVQL